MMDGLRDSTPNTIDPQGSPVLDTCTVIAKDAYPGDLDNNIVNLLQPDPGHGQTVHDSESSVASAATQNPHSSELLEGFMICTLNTEDHEIPCNDDIFPPSDLLPTFCHPLKYKYGETSRSFSSSRDVCDNQKATEHLQAPIKEEREAPAKLTAAPQMLSKVGSTYLRSSRVVKAEFPEGDSLSSSGIADKGMEAPAAVHGIPQSVSVAMSKQDVTTSEMRRHGNSTDSLLVKAAQGFKLEMDLQW